MSDITISYNGNTIGTMDASGTKKLLTAGKYCEDDIDIAYVKPSGVVEAPYNDVNFYDYDGTIVYSYSASDFANLSAMPANPTHDGLTAQGWNWTLADAKAQVLVSGALDIGQMYKTSDGKTRLYIRILDNLAMNLRLYLYQSVGQGVTIDWGDGSATETVSGTGVKSANHTYSTIGDYVITLTVTSGTMKLGGTASNAQIITRNENADGNPKACRSTLRGIAVGDNCEYNTWALYNEHLIEFAIVSTTSGWMNYAYYCRNLKHITIPSEHDYAYARICSALQSISVPKSVATFGASGFEGCSALQRVVFPNGITSLPGSVLYGCGGIVRLVIPSSVASIGASAFRNCEGLMEIHFKPTTPPTLGDGTVFQNVPTTCKIYVPTGKLSAYTSADNYPSSSTYTYIEE